VSSIDKLALVGPTYFVQSNGHPGNLNGVAEGCRVQLEISTSKHMQIWIAPMVCHGSRSVVIDVCESCEEVC